MKRRHRDETWIRQFCDYMAGHHLLARLTDWIAGLVLSPKMQAALAGAMPAPSPSIDDFMGPLLIGTEETYHGRAPDTPADAKDRPGWTWSEVLVPFWGPHHHSERKAEYDRTHTAGLCAEPQYHGMHGRPCKHEGGSDTKCPSGTISGWFWSYDCPGIGRIYYVDCCGGGTPSNRVWCNWTTENNWCIAWGRAANQSPAVTKYFCTLAIPAASMRTVDLGGGKYEVSGVDP